MPLLGSCTFQFTHGAIFSVRGLFQHLLPSSRENHTLRSANPPYKLVFFQNSKSAVCKPPATISVTLQRLKKSGGVKIHLKVGRSPTKWIGEPGGSCRFWG
jgi:hypothetical protein